MRKTNSLSKKYPIRVLASSIALLLGTASYYPAHAQTMAQPTLSTRGAPILKVDEDTTSLYFRDANKNNALDIYEDWRLSTEDRVVDLLSKMTTNDKIGLLVIGSQALGSSTQGRGACGKPGDFNILCESETKSSNNPFSSPGDSFEFAEQEVVGNVPATEGILLRAVRHMIDRSNADPETLTIWTNALQEVAEASELGIPVVVASNPRNHNTDNVGFGLQESSGTFSLWPSTLGMASAFIGDMKQSEKRTDFILDFAKLAAEEWAATGVRKMYGYMADTATDPRWFRIADTFGDSPEIVAEATRQIVLGFQGAHLGQDSVGMTTKHFPGGGARDRGTDPHFVYGQYSPYPTKDSLYRYHLPGFIAAIDAGTVSIMPYYARPNDKMSLPQLYLEGIPDEDKIPNKPGDGSTLFTFDLLGNRVYDPLYLAKLTPTNFIDAGFTEELGFAYSEKIIDKLLRGQLGFTGYVNSDSGILTGMAWGLENASLAERIAQGIKNGTDIFGDLSDVELFNNAFKTQEKFSETVLNLSAGRLLGEVFNLGMFENPYRDPQVAVKLFSEKERLEQSYQGHQKSVVVLKNSGDLLPLTQDKIGEAPVYIEFFSNGDQANRANDTLALYQALKTQAPWMNVTFDIDKANYALLFVKPTDTVGLFDQSAEFLFNLQVGHGTGIDIERINEIQSKVPTVVNVNFSMPWLLENIEPGAVALTGSFATVSEAIVDVLTGNVNPVGALPLTLPRNEGEVVKAENAEPQEDGDIIAADAPGYLRTNVNEYVYTDSEENQYVTGFNIVWDIEKLPEVELDPEALLTTAQKNMVAALVKKGNVPERNMFYLDASKIAERVTSLGSDVLNIVADNTVVNKPNPIEGAADAALKDYEPSRSMNPGLFVTKNDLVINLASITNSSIYQKEASGDNVYSAGVWFDAPADNNVLWLNNSTNFAYSNGLSAYGIFQNASARDNLIVLNNALNLSISEKVAHGIYHGNNNAENVLTDTGYDSGRREAFSHNAVILDNAYNYAYRHIGAGTEEEDFVLSNAFTNIPVLVMKDSHVGGNITQTKGDDFLLSFNTKIKGKVELSEGNDTFVFDTDTTDFSITGKVTPDYLFNDNIYIYDTSCITAACDTNVTATIDGGTLSILNQDSTGNSYQIASVNYGRFNPFNVYVVGKTEEGDVVQQTLLNRDSRNLIGPLIEKGSYTFANDYEVNFAAPVGNIVRALDDSDGSMMVNGWTLAPDRVITPKGYQLVDHALFVPKGMDIPGLITGKQVIETDPTYVLTSVGGKVELTEFNEPRVVEPGKKFQFDDDALFVRNISSALDFDGLVVALNEGEDILQFRTSTGVLADVDLNTLSALSIRNLPESLSSKLHADSINYLLDLPSTLNKTLLDQHRSTSLVEGELSVYLEYLAENRTYQGTNGLSGSKGKTQGVAIGIGSRLTDELSLFGQFAQTYGKVASGEHRADMDLSSLGGSAQYRFIAQGNSPFIGVAGQVGWSHYESTRYLGDQQAKGDSDGNVYAYELVAGYDYQNNGWQVTPALSFRGTNVKQDAFVENGSTNGLDVDKLSEDRQSMAFQLSTSHTLTLDQWQLTPGVFIEYERRLQGDTLKSESRRIDTGATAEALEIQYSKNVTYTGAELNARYQNWNIALRGQGIFGSDTTGGGVSLNVSAQF